MARPQPVGFSDNYRTFSFVSNDGSGFTFFRKASFSVEESSLHKLYAGPSIASTNATADGVITTNEPHGFVVGQSVVIHGLTSPASAVLNGAQIVTAVPSTTTFQVGVDTTEAESAVTAGSFVVGQTYTITTVGTTNFVSIGASASTVGVVFLATGAGTGTGTAILGDSTIGVGIVGVDIEARIPVANYCCIPGDLCVNDHPAAWEMPLVG